MQRKDCNFHLIDLASQAWAAGAKPLVDESLLPPLPVKDKRGHYPAVEYARAVLARKIISARMEQNLSQAALARRAGIQPAVLNRIEKGKVTADVATVDRIHRALGGK